MAATTVWPSMALPSRRTPMRASVHSHGVAPLFRARYFRTGTKPIWQSGLSRSTYPFPQDLKRSPVRTLLTASLNKGATSVRTLLTTSLNRGATPTMGMDGKPAWGYAC